MVGTAIFLGLIMLVCMTVIVVGATVLLIFSGIGLAKEMWNEIKHK